MPDTDIETSNEVAAARSVIMRDLVSVDAYAEAVGKGRETIERWIRQKKLPVVYFGRTPRVVLSRARQELMAPIEADPPNT